MINCLIVYVLVNRVSGHYPEPLNLLVDPTPFFNDVPPIVPSTYIPPNIYPPLGVPPNQVLTPVDNSDSVVISPPNQLLSPVPNSSPVQIVNMSCLDSKDGGGYFRTYLRSTSSSKVFPSMESSGTDCMVTPTLTDKVFQISLEGQKMIDCGVRSCGNKMCLVLRMGIIPGLKLADDPVVVLQCIPQEIVASQTKHFRLSTQEEQGRSNTKSVSVASGGNQRRLETQVNLLKKTTGSNTFDQDLQQGSAVRLGDELLLRAIVRSVDGWRFSHMGPVIIRSATSQKSIFLVDERGCRNPTVRHICPQQPQQINPLMIQLPFRAFLFQGAAPVDDLLLSVRVLGCLQSHDCHQNKICEDERKTRVTRTAQNITETEADVVTEFQFRVLPNDAPNTEEDSKGCSYNKNNDLIFIVSLMIVCISLLFVIIILMKKSLKRRAEYADSHVLF